MRGTQTVVTHILIHAGTFIVVESIHDRLCGWHTTPDGGVHIDHRGRRGQTILKTLAAVAQNIFADVTQVDV